VTYLEQPRRYYGRSLRPTFKYYSKKEGGATNDQQSKRSRAVPAILTLVDPKQEAHDSADEEKQPDEVEFAGVFPERLALMWVEVQKEKEEEAGNSARWSRDMELEV
jgi:hypothetical protein